MKKKSHQGKLLEEINMRSFKNSAMLYLAILWCCHLTYAGDELNMAPDPMNKNSFLEKRSITNPEELSKPENAQGHQMIKRTPLEPLYFTPMYCKLQGYCGLMPVLSIICLVKCNFENVALLKPFLGLITELPMFMCQVVNTMFPNMPKKFRKQSEKFSNVKSYLKLFNVQADEEADFAKTSANALPVTMIKNLKGPTYDELKPAIKKLEIHDTDKKIRKKVNFAGRLFGSILNLGTGQFVNQKCDKTNLDDEALRLIAAMKLRKCSLDLLMPGYFVFNAAPKVASNREILPLLKVFNMPLLMFTGVKCCMVKYAIYNFKAKCIHEYDLLNKPHGLVSSNGPATVCNAIPTFSPITPRPGPTTIDPAQPEETTTTVSPCEDENNKSELEECVTESASVDYSEEATESIAIIGENVNATGGSEEIESDENEY